MEPRPRPWLLPLSFVLVLLLGVSAGVHVERRGWLPGSPNFVPARLGDTFDPFWEAWGLVEQYYVDREAIQPKRMTEGAIDGMLASLGDVGHTTYLTPDEAKQMSRSLEGKLEGIGAQMTIRDRRPTIVYTFPGTPARESGLRPGDVLLEVDGKPVGSLPLEQVARLVQGPPGSVVQIRVTREGEAKALDFRIRRARIDVPVVSWALLPGGQVAHVAIRDFANKADAQLRAAIAQAREKGAKGLILDVRGNPGGLRDQAVAVTSEFLSEGTVFIEQDARGRKKAVPVKPGGTATTIPLCLLIDGGTASSAEILAGAIQDHGRAKLVGTRTFGTGTVLEPFELSDGSEVLLAIAQWLTPKGRKIWHEGITPDIEVDLPEQANILSPETETNLTAEALAKSEDKQLLKALEVLQQQMSGGN
jgi:carboxyl-terminal processing protease